MMTATIADQAKEPADDNGKTVVDVSLFKAIGLYQILWPGGNRYRDALVIVLWLAFGLQCVQTIRLYLAIGDIQLALYIAVLIVNGLMGLYKGHVLVTKADHLRVVLDVARYDFVSTNYGLAMSQCRTTVSVMLRAFAALSYVTMAVWLVLPDSVRRTRTSQDDLFAATDFLITLIEMVVFLVNVCCWVLFDCYIVTVCFALKTHLQNIYDTFESLDRSRHGTPSPIPYSADDNVCINCNNLNDYDELYRHILENQKIIKKLDDFFDIVRPVAFFQIANSSFALITLICLSLMSYFTNFTIISVTFFQFCIGAISITIELFIYCYIFDNLETVKSNVNFALYCSDWTTMDIKCKQILLTAMIINSSHKRVIKLSQNSIVNLEMFVRVLKLSYSIISVVVNSRSELK